MKALILTYYFPPCTATAGYRPYSWATNFSKVGIEPTVVTRHWGTEDETRQAYASYIDAPVEVEETHTHTIIKLPYRPTFKRQIGERHLSTFPVLRKGYYFLLALLGEINIDMDGYSAYYKYLINHLQKNHYDVILATAPPFNLIRLAKTLSKRFNIPYVVDFRDLWNNHEMKVGFRYQGTDKILFRLIKAYIARWISDARLITVATPPMKRFIEALGYKKEIAVLLNGFEQELYAQYTAILPKKNRFVIACVGTLYVDQDIQVFSKGIHLFIKEQPDASIELRFIGVGFDPRVEQLLKQNLPSSILVTSPRVPRDNAIKETLSAHVLYYPGWKGFEGILTTKIFDYLAAKRTILIAPGDNSSLDELVNKTRAGEIANSSQEVCRLIRGWYTEWQMKGEISYYGDIEQIKKYSREQQSFYFSGLLKDKVII